jgi:hypothetical protein
MAAGRLGTDDLDDDEDADRAVGADFDRFGRTTVPAVGCGTTYACRQSGPGHRPERPAYWASTTNARPHAVQVMRTYMLDSLQTGAGRYWREIQAGRTGRHTDITSNGGVYQTFCAKSNFSADGIPCTNPLGGTPRLPLR